MFLVVLQVLSREKVHDLIQKVQFSWSHFEEEQGPPVCGQDLPFHTLVIALQPHSSINIIFLGGGEGTLKCLWVLNDFI